ncbi:hypothetical protein HJFPF1_05644 [Paramyrothecium foliicola]|nr:hypothetical protein HJFPF1_05644 [Paramyrothecium foliicola]
MALSARTTSAPVASPTIRSTPNLLVSNRKSQASTVKLNHDDGLTARLALRQQFAKTNPKYSGSFGAVAFERSTSSGLKLVGWRVTNLAQQIWLKLEEPLFSLIMEKRPSWERDRPRKPSEGQHGGIQAPIYALRCFLLGPDKAHATPHVAILCSVGWFRKAVGAIIAKSGLLLSDGFKCFGLPDKPELFWESSPKKAGKYNPNSTLTGTVARDSNVHDKGSRSATQAHIRDSTEAPVGVWTRLDDFRFILPSDVDFNREIQAEIDWHGAVVGMAAIGGDLQIGNTVCGLSVRHAFQNPYLYRPFEDNDYDIDCEIDMFEDGEGEDNMEEDEPQLYSAKSRADRLAGRQSSPLMSVSQRPGVRTLETEHESYGSLYDVFTASEAKLDWTITVLPAGDSTPRLAVPRLEEESNVAVMMKTSSKELMGVVESTGILGVPVLTTPQRVLVVSMVAIEPGDCGTWVVRTKDRAVIGMLIGACPALGEAYVLRINHILEDILEQTGVKATIVSPRYDQKPEALPPFGNETHKRRHLNFREIMKFLLIGMVAGTVLAIITS